MDGPSLSSVVLSPAPVFELRHISKQFPGVKALDDVSLTFRDREIHGLVGENGAGKSTLMSIMMGLQPPDTGTLVRRGEAVSFAGSTEALAAGLGMVPQELNLVPQMTVMENVLLGFAPGKIGGVVVDWKTVRHRARAVLDRIGADVSTDAIAGDLSAAQQQLVQIARALALGAEILIFDEPTASLSLREADHLLALIRQLREDGCSIIYISHRLEEILTLCDRITVLRNGCKVVELEAAGTTEADLVRNMIGREVTAGKRVAPTDRATHDDTVAPFLSVESLSCAGHFEDISLTVRPGEIVGLAGLVGAGRTELARCIFGDLRPTGGRILREGRPIHLRHPSDAIKAGLAYVPEERKRLGIFPVLGVSENMTLPILRSLCAAGRINRATQRAYVDDYIAKLDIKTSDPDKPIRDLSGGNQQKVILARWLLTGCRMLILDEPTRGIDVNAKFEIHALLRRLVADGMAILLISSELEEVIQLADRVLVMNNGRLKGEIPAWDATQEAILSMAVG
ncbi:sugar ABC transporter ATP-binding protein [Roseospira marina]|uniref:Sugar ABC transporter ATP-binding protein n=1 Tax=Roseospira marina TaxID=140057 RepID=A0A5M6IAN4_9PROT|nr:sugar ABC transporter ATP-binding protein [Roseospira marina]KAA5605336.1 sugar ABC transporter ATP-binding protein [Roseospira marina]MBB4314809.1 ABC-type sugar transport system ATPase subunit [Roseospira marina]MBB5087798.1 ABC-type sugar transport system ATPase subunit [Roseospira marina]